MVDVLERIAHGWLWMCAAFIAIGVVSICIQEIRKGTESAKTGTVFILCVAAGLSYLIGGLVL